MSVKSISSTPANGTAPAQVPNKEKTARVVQNALVQGIVTNLQLDPGLTPTLAKKEELVQNAMSLTTQKTAEPLDMPAFKLGLTKQELQLVNDMFSRWALYDQICLMELWGLDLYTEMVQLAKYLPNGSEIVERFCADFILGHISLCTLDDKKSWPVELEFSTPGVKSKNRTFLRSPNQWVTKLSSTKSALQQLASSKARVSAVSSLLRSIKQKIELGERLLMHPHANDLLCKYNLNKLAEELLPQATAINNSSPKKTLTDLIQYVQFISRSFEASIKLGYLGLDQPWLYRLGEQFSKLSEDQSLFQAVKRLKRELAPLVADMHKMGSRFKEACAAAGKGTLDASTFYGATSNKNPHEFASQLYLNVVALSLTLQFLYDFLDILDQQVMEPLYPDTFVATTTGLTRFNLNLAAAFQDVKGLLEEIRGEKPSMRFPKPPGTLSPQQQVALGSLLAEFNPNTLFLRNLLELRIEEYYHAWEALNRRIRFHLHLWLPFVQELQPLVKTVTGSIDRLDATRQAFLQGIEKFLRTLDPQELRAHRKEWTHLFTEYSFQESLALCRWTMIAQDAKAISQLHVNLAVVNSEDHLLPPPLLSFMALEGIEQLFSKLLDPQQPMHEDLDERPPHRQRVQAAVQPILAPAKPLVVEKPESKKQPAPQAVREEGKTPSDFTIYRNETTRSIIARLREMGFFPTRTRRGGTSHLKLEDEKGQTVIVPTGGKRHKHQRRGTARSIAAQVNQKA